MTHRRRFEGTLEGAAQAGPWVHEVAAEEQLSSPESYALELCIEELLVNIAKHGGSGRGNQSLAAVVSIEVGVDGISVAIEDTGVPFDLSQAPGPSTPLTLDDTLPGGLGIPLLRSFSSEVRHEALPDGNRVRLRLLRQPEAKTGSGT